MKFKYWLPILVSTAFVGCASVPQANPQLAQQAKQLTAPTNGNAVIYVYRSNNIVGSALKKMYGLMENVWAKQHVVYSFIKKLLVIKNIQFQLNQNFRQII